MKRHTTDKMAPLHDRATSFTPCAEVLLLFATGVDLCKTCRFKVQFLHRVTCTSSAVTCIVTETQECYVNKTAMSHMRMTNYHSILYQYFGSTLHLNEGLIANYNQFPIPNFPYRFVLYADAAKEQKSKNIILITSHHVSM